MPRFAVHFKGMLAKSERERLTAAGIELAGSRASMVVGNEEAGLIGTGRPIYTVTVEAASDDEALTKVREALEPATSNFTGWKAECP